MSFVGSRVLVALIAAVALPVLCQSAVAAEKRSITPVSKTAQPSGAELVGKLLSEENGPSNPDVPLPQRGLSLSQNPASKPLAGPQVFGRQEDVGGVFGLKFPIPVTRSAN